jgi:Icc-related predicted phosphoesterase
MKKILITIISDTHSKHNKIKIPQCDILIHCGDISSMGREHEVRDFLKWFSKQPAEYKIFIAGNHDFMFENNGLFARSLVPSDIIYLEDTFIEVLGLKIYGTPVNPMFFNWAFNRTEENLKKHWEAIPENIDILITHCPPFGIMDAVNNRYNNYINTNTGSPSLNFEIFNRIKPKINCFGHIHQQNGVQIINNIKFINASVLDDNYDLVYDPITIEI